MPVMVTNHWVGPPGIVDLRGSKLASKQAGAGRAGKSANLLGVVPKEVKSQRARILH